MHRANVPCLLSLLAVAMLLLPISGGPPLARAQAAGWERMPIDLRVFDLFTPSSGALLVMTSNPAKEKDWGLARSDDAGATWRSIALPSSGATLPPERHFEVDPFDHQIIYTTAIDGLYRTGDDGASWQRVSDVIVDHLTVSHVDPNVMYAVPRRQGPGRLLRSLDRGATWTTLPPLIVENAPCFVESTGSLTALPDDPNGVIVGAACEPAGRQLEHHLLISRDRADSWTVLERDVWPSSGSLLPTTGVSQLFLLTSPSSVRNSEWDIRRYEDGQFATLARMSSGRIPGTISADRTNPRQLFGVTLEFLYSSTDGGATWTQLPDQPSTSLFSVAVGVDGKYLFLSASEGLLRKRLGE